MEESMRRLIVANRRVYPINLFTSPRVEMWNTYSEPDSLPLKQTKEHERELPPFDKLNSSMLSQNIPQLSIKDFVSKRVPSFSPQRQLYAPHTWKISERAKITLFSPISTIKSSTFKRTVRKEQNHTTKRFPSPGMRNQVNANVKATGKDLPAVSYGKKLYKLNEIAEDPGIHD